MNYTLNQLHIFLKIVNTQSITKAAEELHLTQPAVSIQLKNFQDQFEIPLTEIVGRRLYITDFGNEIAASVADILNLVNTINYKTLTHKGQLSGRLKIAVVSTGKYVMPYFLTGFMNNNAGVELSMDVTNKNKVIEVLEKNEIDFALVSIIPPSLKVEKLDLLQNKLFLVGSSKLKIKREFTTKDIFESFPVIFREKGSGTRQTMESFIKRRKININKQLELTSNEAVKQALLAELGISIMPLIGIKNELRNNDLQIIPTKGLPIKTVWSLIWLKGKKHSLVSKSFLEFLKKEKTKIFEERFSWYES